MRALPAGQDAHGDRGARDGYEGTVGGDTGPGALAGGAATPLGTGLVAFLRLVESFAVT